MDDQYGFDAVQDEIKLSLLHRVMQWSRDRPGGHDSHVCCQPIDTVPVGKDDDTVSLFYSTMY